MGDHTPMRDTGAAGKETQIEHSLFWARLIDELLEFFQRADLAGQMVQDRLPLGRTRRCA